LSSIGATYSGNRYQVGTFWWHVSQLLVDDSLDLVELESDEVTAIDDVVCHYSAPRPIQGTGLSYKSDYFQIKYHVDQSNALSYKYLIDEKAVSTKHSILERFFKAFTKLQDQGNSRLNLVTNWGWDHTDPLAETLRRGHFNPRYLESKGAKAAAEAWRDKLQCDEKIFEIFLSRLAVRCSFDLQQQREALSDRLQLAGLAPIDLTTEHSPYDDLGLRLVEAGKTKFDKAFLTDFVKKNGVYVREPQRTNSRNGLAIRTYKKIFDGSPLMSIVDLSHWFNERAIKEGFDWNNDVYADLMSSLDQASLSVLSNPIETHLDCHLSVAFAAGKVLSPKSGYQVNLRQRVRGVPVVWNSHQSLANPAAKLSVTYEGDHKATDLVISVSISKDANEDVLAEAQKQGLNYDFLKLSSPVVGQTAVVNGDDAWVMAESFANEIRAHLRKFSVRPKVHLFLAAPVALAFRMGQESSMLGSLLLYEFDFTGNQKYLPSIQIP
jgi:hypothetical protein